MDFDLDSFFDVENVINAIFNGVPQVTDHKPPKKPPLRRSQTSLGPSGASGASGTSTFPPIVRSASIPGSAPIYSLGRIVESGYHPSLSNQLNDVHKQARPGAHNMPCPPPPPPVLSPELDHTPSVYVDNSKTVVLAPDLDMSSAIALSKTIKSKGKRTHEIAFGDEDGPVTPARYISIEEACQPPEKRLRDELVKLYFIHFHPFCPVVNEVEFMEIYRDIEDDEQLKERVSIPLLQAMMNVAFGHLPSERLPSTPFKTIYEGQKAYFEKASLLYRVRHTPDHLILTKIALLLTYWSPFDSEYQVNNYWTDRAFYHARVIRLWDRPGENAVTSRRYRLIWWCCLLRDRLISIAMRRPYRIHEAKSAWPLVTEADFGLEVMFPKFITVKTKKSLIQAFIWLCKLSDIMRDIAVFHEQTRFDREWSGKRIDQAKIMSEASRVAQFDTQLRSWREEYLKVNGEYIASLKVGTSKFPNYVLMICDSIFATLYIPYIHCPPGSSRVAQKFQKIALRRIKEASCATALHCYKTSQGSKVGEEFIIGIIAWIALPMAVFKTLKEKDGVSGEINGRCYEDFVPFVSALATRFRPAMLLADIMGESTSEIVERSAKLGITQTDIHYRLRDPYNRPFAVAIDDPLNTGNISTDEDEAEILNCVAKMVDLRFSTDGST